MQINGRGDKVASGPKGKHEKTYTRLFLSSTQHTHTHDEVNDELTNDRQG